MPLLPSLLNLILFALAPQSSSFFAAAAIVPDRAPVNFANKIDTQFVSIQGADDPSGVFYFGNVWHPYDRDLPRRGGFLCDGNAGTIVRDETVQEAYAYSCCADFQCPLPPPEQPDVIRALSFERPVEVWAWDRNTTEWQRTPDEFVYYDEPTSVGIAKRFLAVVVMATFMLGVLSIVASLLHSGTNRFPALCFVIHAMTLICIAIVNTEAIGEVKDDPSYRGGLIRAGLVHTFVMMTMSPVLIYTPSAAEDDDHRIRSACGERLSRAAHTKCAKRFASIICLLHALVGDALGSYALMDSAWSILDAEFEVLVGIGLCYAVGTSLHLVAFVTAINEIEVPLRLEDPQSPNNPLHYHVTRHKSRVNVRRHIVGMHDEDTGALRAVPRWRGTPFHVYASHHCNLGVTLAVWDVGVVSRGEVHFRRRDGDGEQMRRIEEGHRQRRSPDGGEQRQRSTMRSFCCCCSRRPVKLFLPHCEQDTDVHVCTSNGDFEKIGSVVKNRFHYDLSVTASLINTVLHVAPQLMEDDEYSLNVVHNMRAWMHEKQRNCGMLSVCGQPVYGLLWWAMLIVSSAVSLTVIASYAEPTLLAPFYVLETLSVFSLAIFGAVVGLKEEEERKTSTSVIPLNPPRRAGGKMRDGTFTCFNGHTCMVVDSASGWFDDMTQEDIPDGVPCFYCYRCDFTVRKED